MRRQEFIKELKKELSGLAAAEIEDIIRDYEEMISDALTAGKTEESIIQSFGAPKDLAKTLKAETKIDKASYEKKLSRQIHGIFGAVGALLFLAPFNLIVVLGPFLTILAILLLGWVIALAIGAITVAMMWSFFAGILFVGTAATMAHVSTFFTFLGSLGLSTLFIIGMYYTTKLVSKIILSYLKWNLNFIKNQAKGAL